jgi:hypothetical protein
MKLLTETEGSDQQLQFYEALTKDFQDSVSQQVLSLLVFKDALQAQLGGKLTNAATIHMIDILKKLLKQDPSSASLENVTHAQFILNLCETSGLLYSYKQPVILQVFANAGPKTLFNHRIFKVAETSTESQVASVCAYLAPVLNQKEESFDGFPPGIDWLRYAGIKTQVTARFTPESCRKKAKPLINPVFQMVAKSLQNHQVTELIGGFLSIVQMSGEPYLIELKPDLEAAILKVLKEGESSECSEVYRLLALCKAQTSDMRHLLEKVLKVKSTQHDEIVAKMVEKSKEHFMFKHAAATEQEATEHFTELKSGLTLYTRQQSLEDQCHALRCYTSFDQEKALKIAIQLV